MDKMEKRFAEVEEKVVRNEGSVQEVTKKVDTIEKRQDKVEDMLEKEREKMRMERVEEMRERELRRKNVIIHRMEEAGDWAKSVEERREWDTNSCGNMFKELRIDWGKEAIRFCRRIGERGEEPRPLVVGLQREAQKEDLLEKARMLKETYFENVGIVPDLTQEQRKDEADMILEAERRNANRSEDERAKNLVWRVVGRRGEKRIIKGLERGENQGGENWRTRGRGMGGRGSAVALLPRGGRGGQWVPGRGSGGGGRGRGAGAGGERESVLELVRGDARTRLGSKRVREGDETDETQQPPPQPQPTQQPVVPQPGAARPTGPMAM